MENGSISNIDKNFQIKSSLSEKDIVFFDIRENPFKVFGLYNFAESGKYLRLPEEVADKVNEGVKELNYHTAGGRLRFSTNSPYVAIFCRTKNTGLMSHMPLLGSSGYDMYIDADSESTFYKSFIPPAGFSGEFESIVYFNDQNKDDMRSITINFPLYNSIEGLFIGLHKDAAIKEGAKYKYQKPVVYYGSSITQGGCASRPGNSYQAIISRWLDSDHINLGFSGSARGEETIARYIAGLEMSVFVMDYDHNAPSVEHLESTHEKFYRLIRESNRGLPIIFISKPDFENNRAESRQRRDIIYRTYISAVKEGDNLVTFIDGESLFGTIGRDSCTVDSCHPNDLGFMRMAETICPYVKRALAGIE